MSSSFPGGSGKHALSVMAYCVARRISVKSLVIVRPLPSPNAASSASIYIESFSVHTRYMSSAQNVSAYLPLASACRCSTAFRECKIAGLQQHQQLRECALDVVFDQLVVFASLLMCIFILLPFDEGFVGLVNRPSNGVQAFSDRFHAIRPPSINLRS